MPKPAAEGGRPVRAKYLPYGQHALDDEDRNAVLQAMRSPLITQGPRCEQLEKVFASVVGASEAIAVSSGTAALHAAVAMLDLAPGDEVIVPAITFAATANAVVYAGATPVFADVDRETGLIDPDSAAERITKRTRAMIPVHYAGHPAPMKRLRALARRHNLAIVVDAAHALGSVDGDHPVGSGERLCVFSTHPVKHITTGEGGFVTTTNRALAERLRRFRTHGITRTTGGARRVGDWFYEMVELGYNYRLNELGAALGLSQLAKLKHFVERRRELADRYDQALADRDYVRSVPEPKGTRSAYHIYPVLLDLPRFRISKKALFAALRAENIGVQVHYIPVYHHPFYLRLLRKKRANCPGAERFYEREVTLPLFPAMTDRDQDDVLEAVQKLFDYYKK